MTIVLELEQIERKRFNVLPILSTNEEFKGRDRMTKMQISTFEAKNLADKKLGLLLHFQKMMSLFWR